ncbi:MAG: hypothetical protein A3I04_04405 [Nitrospinae bacterium RIFCSPLOWO2_02_FULL_39_110]|nr:MAG: hypothetical protein A3I04_04405 [Nitrospinae bacterium RIFCSPLOWO2_02_FULL_39_110]
MTTLSLPYVLQLEAGHFFTEFGRINPKHPSWDMTEDITANIGFSGLYGPNATGSGESIGGRDMVWRICDGNSSFL